MKLRCKRDNTEVEVISYGKIKKGSKWLNSISFIDATGKETTQICEKVQDYFEQGDEESCTIFHDSILDELYKMVSKILGILLKQTDPEELDKENFNDFIMNIVANLVAKSLEKILKL